MNADSRRSVRIRPQMNADSRRSVRTFAQIFAVWLAASMGGHAAVVADEASVTWTGWFSDLGCASSRVSRGDIGPNGTECVKRCIDEGATPVFISEQAKALFEVRDYPDVKDDVGYHVEVTGRVDETAKTISVTSVKRLSKVVQMCARPKKNTDRQ
jgi:hypothetical protein